MSAANAPAQPAPRRVASDQRLHALARASPDRGAALLGIIDTARDEQLYDALQAEPRQSQVTCLYDGIPAVRYGRYAPYLIVLHQDSPLFQRWLDQGWGEHWGIFLVSHASPAKLKRHFKRFLTGVDLQGRPVWLRFYDPRVLPDTLAGLLPGNLQDWFGGKLIQACLAPQPAGLWRGMPQRNLLDKIANSASLQSQVFPIDPPC